MQKKQRQHNRITAIPKENLTPQIIVNYSRFLRNKKEIGETTIGMMMSRTRTIVNRGIKQLSVKYDVHPFANYSIASAPVREVDLTLESFNKIRNYCCPIKLIKCKQ